MGPILFRLRALDCDASFGLRTVFSSEFAGSCSSIIRSRCVTMLMPVICWPRAVFAESVPFTGTDEDDMTV